MGRAEVRIMAPPLTTSCATEVELKLRFPPDALPRLLAHPLFAVDAATKTIVSIYFDMPDQRIRAGGLSLRVRHAGGRRLQTIKASAPGAGLFERAEWVRELDRDTPSAASCADTPLAALIDDWDLVVPLFTVEMVRTARRWTDTDGAIVELALDRGIVVSGDKRAVIFEIEFELKAGRRAAMFELARTIARATALWPSTLSKADIGYGLVAAQRSFGGIDRAGDARAFLARHGDAASACAELGGAEGGALLARLGGPATVLPATDIEMGLFALSMVERLSVAKPHSN